jgi:hypothetical protein
MIPKSMKVNREKVFEMRKRVISVRQQAYFRRK